MKLFLVLMILCLVLGTKSFAGNIKHCVKLKIQGKYHCQWARAEMEFEIKKVNNILHIISKEDNETLIIDGTLRPRIWSKDATYNSLCNKKALLIETFMKGEPEGTLLISPKGPTIAYTMTKDEQSISLDCVKL